MIVLIPARKGSKGIPRKNIVNLGQKPLITYSIRCALSAKSVTKVFVSTDDEEIADIAKSSGAVIPFMRPPELATDLSPASETYKHFLKWYNKEFNSDLGEVCILLPTSPLREPSDIDNAVDLYYRSRAESVVSVCEGKPPDWCVGLGRNNLINDLPVTKNKNRQETPRPFYPNGSIYILSKNVINANGGYYSQGATYGYVMSKTVSVDIDDQHDLAMAEAILHWKKLQKL